MRIIHIIPELRKGGAERMAYDICNYLNSLPEIEIKLITFKNNIINHFGKDSFHKHIPSFYKPSITSKSKKEVRQLQDFINSFKADIVHSHLWETEMLLSNLNFGKAKRVVHLHSNVKQLKKIKLPIRKKDFTNLYEKKKFFKSKIDSIFCVSEDNFSYAKKVLPKFLNYKQILFPNAIDFNKFYSKKNRSLDSINLINVGRFIKLKNQKLSLKIVKELDSMNLNVKMVFLGDGPYLKKCRDIAKNLGICKKVAFVGNVENVKKYYENANIHLHTSTQESFGLVLLEAMATGIPIVTLDGGGNREFIDHKKNGFIFKAQNVELFANQILNLVNNERLYYKIAKNGQETARNYEIKNYIPKLLNVYNKLSLS